MMAVTGRQLKESVKVFQSLMLYRRLPNETEDSGINSVRIVLLLHVLHLNAFIFKMSYQVGIIHNSYYDIIVLLWFLTKLRATPQHITT